MNLIESITAHESERLTVYDDATGKPIQAGSHVLGNPTIGIGTLICAPGGITKAESRLLLQNRLAIAQAAVLNLHTGLSDDDPRFDVLVELAFWIGAAGLSKFTTMLQCIKTCDYEGASKALLSSKLHSQVPKRCEELAESLRNGK